jgi:hypothetical protein
MADSKDEGSLVSGIPCFALGLSFSWNEELNLGFIVNEVAQFYDDRLKDELEDDYFKT